MQRADLVSLFAELRTGEPVIVGPGTTSGALYQADHRAPTIYNMDMGYATAICLGLALAVPPSGWWPWRATARPRGARRALHHRTVRPAEPGRRHLPQRGLRELRRRLGPDGGGRHDRPAAVAWACGIRPQNVVAVATLAEARKALSAALTEPAVGRRGPHRAAGPLAGGPAAAAPRPRGDGRRVRGR